MLPLAQHRPVAIAHPLVDPWARRQETPTANVYRLATLDSERRERPWQVKPARLGGALILSDRDARRKAKRANRKLAEALEAIPGLKKDILLAKLEADEAPDEGNREVLAELEAALAEARGIVDAARVKRVQCLPRAERRKVWKNVKPELRRQAWDEHVRRVGGLA